MLSDVQRRTRKDPFDAEAEAEAAGLPSPPDLVRERWMDPTEGRFITEDPAKEGTNPFDYVHNDPMDYTDPSGMTPFKVDWDLPKSQFWPGYQPPSYAASSGATTPAESVYEEPYHERQVRQYFEGDVGWHPPMAPGFVPPEAIPSDKQITDYLGGHRQEFMSRFENGELEARFAQPWYNGLVQQDLQEARQIAAVDAANDWARRYGPQVRPQGTLTPYQQTIQMIEERKYLDNRTWNSDAESVTLEANQLVEDNHGNIAGVAWDLAKRKAPELAMIVRGRILISAPLRDPQWVQNIQAGNQFNAARRAAYPYNEIIVYGKQSDYVKLDSYNPNAGTGEIVSRKFTQLGAVHVNTARSYIDNLADNYAPGTRIGSTPTVPAELRGLALKGEMILEVPPQVAPIPRDVLDAAAKRNVTIRDSNGRVYP
jgi:RHS repeat-associated protein